MPPIGSYINEIAGLWETGQITNNGVKLQTLERELKRYLCADNVSIFVNGHTALEIALGTIANKGEVITSPFTFTSTLLAIIRNGMKPVFCDIKEEDFTLDPVEADRYITNDTCGILPVHVFGNICDAGAFGTISSEYGIPVIYDAAQAFGISVDGLPVSGLGAVSMFSFHATKVFHTIEGGCLTYSDNKLEEYFSLVRNFGLSDGVSMVCGTNAKMPETNAAMGLCNLRCIDDYIGTRKELTEKYDEYLAGRRGVLLNKIPANVTYNYCYYPIRVVQELYGRSRDELHDYLVKNGVYARKYYYPLVSDYPIISKTANRAPLPVAEKVSRQVLVLPLHTNMDLDDVAYICRLILEFQTS